MRGRSTYLAATVLLVAFLSVTGFNVQPVEAELPAAQLLALFPAGGRQGTIVEVHLAAGRDLDGADRLVFSHPHITAVQKTRPPSEFENGPQPLPGEFTVAIHPDVPPGIYEARSVGRFGMSNPRAFVIGNLPEKNEAADNHAADKAMPVATNVIVNGTCDAAASDFFRLNLKKDQRVVLECQAERIDSRADATLTVFDTSGRQLASDRDSLRHDPLLVFTAPADGDYIVKLNDAVYRGGSEYPYRLHISTGAYVDFVFPPVALAGAKSSFTLYGSNLPGGTPAAGLVSHGRQLEQLSVEIEAPAGARADELAVSSLVRCGDAALDGFEYRLASLIGASNPVLIGLTSAPVVVEQEPNDDPRNPQHVTLPCTLCGRFAPRGDQDWITFEAKKGDVYWIECISQRLGLPTDPYILLQEVTHNDKGEEKIKDLLELDDAPRGLGIASFRLDSDDPASRFTVPDDGTYRILVRDLYTGSRGDPSFVYALSIRRAAPDFRIAAVPAHHGNAAGPPESSPANPLLRRGGTETIDVVALRRDGFAGEIEVTVADLPPGVTADRAVIAADRTETTVVLRATEDAPAATCAIRVIGKASIDGREILHVARPAAVRWGALNNQPPDSRLARDLWLSVLSVENAPFFAEFGTVEPSEMSVAGKIEIPVKLVRRGDMKQPVTLTPLNLPPNVKAKPITIAPDATEGKVAFEIGRKAALGAHNLRLLAQASFSYRRDPQSAEAAEAARQEIDKIAAAKAAQSQAAEKSRQDAEKIAADLAGVAKQSAETAVREAQRSATAAEALKAALERASTAREAAEKETTNEELAQAKAAAEKTVAEMQSQAESAAAAQTAAARSETESAAAAQAAADEKVGKEKTAADAAQHAKAAADAKAAAEKRAKEVSKAAEPKNVNVFESSTSTMLVITPAPVTLSVAATSVALKVGAQVDFSITAARRYGFADPIEIELITPERIKGITAAKQSIAADQSSAALVLSAAAETTVGKHDLIARATFKFGGEDFQVDQPFAVEIEAAP